MFRETWWIVCLWALPATASAQVVRGAVLDAEGGAPLAGAMVVVLDAAESAPVARVLTDAAGAFITKVSRPGRYRIRVDRIGYASLTTEPFDVPAEGVVRQVEVPVEPVRLRGLDVEGSRRCQVHPDEGRVTARVWSEARKALEAAAWTQETGVYRYTLLHYVRDTDRDGKEIVRESRQFKSGSSQAPFISLTAEELALGGYVRSDPDSGTTYHAPDAEAFLSKGFLDTHCFGVRRGPAGEIGLTFTPVEGRDLPDIEGVLWLDEESARLRRLEFSYVNVGRLLDAGEPGGAVDFAGLPNGTWIVSEFRIRMPLFARRLGRLRRIGYRDEGGLAWRIVDRDGSIVMEATTASIAGVVMDSIRAQPVPAARVSVDESGDEVAAANDGSFLLPGLPEGLHTLRVRHGALDALGIRGPARKVHSRLGEVLHVTLRLPRVAEALEDACGGEPRPARTAPLLGRLAAAGDASLAGVRVQLGWPAASGYEPPPLAAPEGPDGDPALEWDTGARGPTTEVVVHTDRRGIFLLCDVPAGARIRVEATASDGWKSSRTAIVPPLADVALITLTMEGRQP